PRPVHPIGSASPRKRRRKCAFFEHRKLIRNAQKSQGDSSPAVAWTEHPGGLDDCSPWDTQLGNEFGQPVCIWPGWMGSGTEPLARVSWCGSRGWRTETPGSISALV